MGNRPFELLKQGLVFYREPPLFGSQDVGISPGGPMDRLSTLTGNIMLDQADFCESLEIILPPVIKILKPLCFVLTGAPRVCILRSPNEEKTIPHGVVVYAPSDSELRFHETLRGFRTIITWRALNGPEEKEIFAGRERGTFESLFTFFDREGAIRVLPGPEFDCLSDPSLFTSDPWKMSSDSNDMGCRLEGPSLMSRSEGNMISDAVSDGTVQLTPRGPIILLYHRQTVGGYPRIFNVISPDLDRIAQFSPGERIHFKTLSFEEAEGLNRLKAKEIGLFRSRFDKS